MSEVTDRFDALRQWVSEIRASPGLRIVWRDARHRVHGMQRLPQEIWVGTPEAALTLIGRKRDAATIDQLVTLTRAEGVAHPSSSTAAITRALASSPSSWRAENMSR